MRARRGWCGPGGFAKLFVATAAVLTAAVAAAQTPSAHTVRPMLWQTGMPRSEIGEVNVFRRFSSERTEAMRHFYGEILGLPVLPATALGGNQMIRYPLGLSEVKLFPVAPTPANTATIRAATGMRLLTFFFDDQAALTQRFAKAGLEPPDFRPTSHVGAAAAGLTQDPDGEWVELVIVPNATADQLARFEIGLTVADLEKSRAFYRDFMGLDEHAPVHDDLLGTQRYRYTHGTTTINLWSFGQGLPADSQTGGMQYIVWNVAAVNDVAVQRGAPIDRPLSDPGQMRTVWLTDPNGVSNYFAEFAGNDNTPPRR